MGRHTVEDAVVGPSPTARNLGVTANITTVTPSCRFALYNIRQIRPFLTREAVPPLVQALVISRLDYYNSLLAGLPASAIKPLQHIQNAAAQIVYNLPKLFRDLHRLPVAARIRFKTMVLTYKAVNGTALTYLQALIRPHTPARADWLAGTAIPESKQRSHSQVTTLLCLGATGGTTSLLM